jgi:hypothetical protein
MEAEGGLAEGGAGHPSRIGRQRSPGCGRGADERADGLFRAGLA